MNCWWRNRRGQPAPSQGGDGPWAAPVRREVRPYFAAAVPWPVDPAILPQPKPFPAPMSLGYGQEGIGIGKSATSDSPPWVRQRLKKRRWPQGDDTKCHLVHAARPAEAMAARTSGPAHRPCSVWGWAGGPAGQTAATTSASSTLAAQPSSTNWRTALRCVRAGQGGPDMGGVRTTRHPTNGEAWPCCDTGDVETSKRASEGGVQCQT